MILQYCQAGLMETHVRGLAKTYAGHRDVMIKALGQEIPEASFTVPDGGYYLWLRLPDKVDSDRLLVAARRRSVDFLPANQFYASAPAKNHLRLAYSFASPSEIIEGVRRLAQALKDIAY
jgi:DNA-binding transcriptional MocR family regulator